MLGRRELALLGVAGPGDSISTGRVIRSWLMDRSLSGFPALHKHTPMQSPATGLSPYNMHGQ